jgi:hypothetical protein
MGTNSLYMTALLFGLAVRQYQENGIEEGKERQAEKIQQTSEDKICQSEKREK